MFLANIAKTEDARDRFGNTGCTAAKFLDSTTHLTIVEVYGGIR